MLFQVEDMMIQRWDCPCQKKQSLVGNLYQDVIHLLKMAAWFSVVGMMKIKIDTKEQL